MKITICSIVIAGLLSGCTAERLVRDNIVPDCPGDARRATPRAVECMTAAFYDIAKEEYEASRDRSPPESDEIEPAEPEREGQTP